MTATFSPLPSASVQAGTGFKRPDELPRIIHAEDAALEVFTDFGVIHPVTVSPDMQIDEALERMKSAGVRLLLVIDEADKIIGLITAADIQGERPVELVQEDRVPRSQISVRMLMTAQPDIVALKMENVQYAQVGDIVESLKQLESQHVLVVDSDSETGQQLVCGLFSMSQISKLMGRGHTESTKTAHSLAEVVHERH